MLFKIFPLTFPQTGFPNTTTVVDMPRPGAPLQLTRWQVVPDAMHGICNVVFGVLLPVVEEVFLRSGFSKKDCKSLFDDSMRKPGSAGGQEDDDLGHLPEDEKVQRSIAVRHL